MKKHFINYYTTAGTPREWDTTSIDEFERRLYEILEDPHTVRHSISFRTEVTKVVEPELVSYPPSKEEVEREREYQEFKAYKK